MKLPRSDWPATKLSAILELKYGKNLPEAARLAGKVRVYGSNGQVGLHDRPLTAGETIIVGRKGSIGAVNYSDASCWPIDTTYYCDSLSTQQHLGWLKHLLQSLDLSRLNKAVAIPGLNREDVYRIEIPLPKFEEQRRIAAVLDQAEALRAKRRRALTKLDLLSQSLFFEMFGDPVTNSKRLKIEPLGRHLQFITSGGRGWAKFYAPSGARFIRSLDVQMNYIGAEDVVYVSPPDNAEAQRTKVKRGDVLLTITGSRIGRVATARKDLEGAYISQHVAILRLVDGIDPEFLSFFLSLDAGGQRQIAASQYGQTKPGLNFDQIRRFLIPVPSADQQNEFRRRLRSFENLKASGNAAMTSQDALFASIQYRAFRGELW